MILFLCRAEMVFLSGIRSFLRGVRTIFFWFWFCLRVRSMMSNCDILSRFFFISLGVSPSTANVSAVQKKQRIQVNLGHHVRLNCHHHPTFDKWRPHTKWKKNVKWFKNGRRLRPKALPKNISIKNKRRKSMLIISNVSHKDLASYQCKTQSGARSKFQIIQQVPPLSSTQVTTTEKSPKVPVENTRILEGQNCPLDGYCLNGGTCRYFQAIGELSCLCASDFYGQRCEFKGVNTHNIVLRSHSSSKCVLGITHYPCWCHQNQVDLQISLPLPIIIIIITATKFWSR